MRRSEGLVCLPAAMLLFLSADSICAVRGQVTSGCFEEANFSYFLETANFSEAVTLCEREGGTLARISNESEFNFVHDLVNNATEPESFLVGKRMKTTLVNEEMQNCSLF